MMTKQNDENICQGCFLVLSSIFTNTQTFLPLHTLQRIHCIASHTTYPSSGIYGKCFTIIFTSMQTFVWDLMLWFVVQAIQPIQPTLTTHTHIYKQLKHSAAFMQTHIDREYIGVAMQLGCVFSVLLYCDFLSKNLSILVSYFTIKIDSDRGMQCDRFISLLFLDNNYVAN